VRDAGCDSLLTREERHAVELVDGDLDQAVAALNERFVEAELDARARFFETIEKSPLTAEQARAVVTFDNRVQLLAAAGSGKTSVMVARAAYAVSRDLVPPDKILLLAFNRNAAAELQERIEARFAAAGIDATGVTASTFHKFGLDLIGQATGKKPRPAAWLEKGADVRTIVEIVEIVRSSCPEVEIRILTNGTRATTELLVDLFEAGLSTLTINNYSDGKRIIAPVKILLERADRFVEHDIRISMRDKDEILTTRAGNAPNKRQPDHPVSGFCALPFTDIYITYTGDVALCCFDSYGSVKMGNIAEDSLQDIWLSDSFREYRSELLRSRRQNLKLCRKCDFDGFRAVEISDTSPRLRNEMLEGLRRL
jgi:radical SAM protein with 4Fe4S-binding SPASM domain